MVDESQENGHSYRSWEVPRQCDRDPTPWGPPTERQHLRTQGPPRRHPIWTSARGGSWGRNTASALRPCNATTNRWNDPLTRTPSNLASRSIAVTLYYGRLTMQATKNVHPDASSRNMSTLAAAIFTARRARRLMYGGDEGRVRVK